MYTHTHTQTPIPHHDMLISYSLFRNYMRHRDVLWYFTKSATFTITLIFVHFYPILTLLLPVSVLIIIVIRNALFHTFYYVNMIFTFSILYIISIGTHVLQTLYTVTLLWLLDFRGPALKYHPEHVLSRPALESCFISHIFSIDFPSLKEIFRYK